MNLESIFYIILLCGLLLVLLFGFTYAANKTNLGKNRAPATPAVDAAYLEQLLVNEYVPVGQCLIECVGSQYSTLGLVRPGPFPQHMAPQGQQVVSDNDNNVYYQYLFDRGVDVSNGGVLSANRLPLSNIPTNFIGRKLAETFPNYCIYAGIGDFRVVGVADTPNCRIRVTVRRCF